MPSCVQVNVPASVAFVRQSNAADYQDSVRNWEPGRKLTAIAGATGGQAFIAEDPTRIGDVFYTALSDMLCQPPAFQPGA